MWSGNKAIARSSGDVCMQLLLTHAESADCMGIKTNVKFSTLFTTVSVIIALQIKLGMCMHAKSLALSQKSKSLRYMHAII